jgi:hypothetical protein
MRSSGGGGSGLAFALRCGGAAGGVGSLPTRLKVGRGMEFAGRAGAGMAMGWAIPTPV